MTMMLIRVRKLVHNFARDEQGATAIEYGLIAALISITVIAWAASFGSRLGGFLTGMGNWFSGISV